ncbi:hypothetical protein H6504_00735 [Candidatus Woesearchaeota archaeon]|nr:hypothetical protein [Candidatus Woesearchaeota archaeon]
MTDGKTTHVVVAKRESFVPGDVIHITGKIKNRKGNIEIVATTIEKLNIKFEEITMNNEHTWQVPSEIYNRLQERFFKANDMIADALTNNRLIVLRYHNDTDGILSAVQLEKAIGAQAHKLGLRRHSCVRQLCKAPFYDLTDALKDIGLNERMGRGAPLIIIMDNGSTPQDLMGIRIAKSNHSKLVIVDHHKPEMVNEQRSTICDEVDVHINPHLVGGSSQICTGMLAHELANIIHPGIGLQELPAIAAIADKSEGPEVDAYTAKVQMDREQGMRYANCIDYIAFQLRTDSGKGVFEKVWSSDAFFSIISGHVSELIKNRKDECKDHLRVIRDDDIKVRMIDLEDKTGPDRFPQPGRTVGLLHDTFSDEKRVTVGVVPGTIIIRESMPVKPLSMVIARLKESFPTIEGGGHEVAGSIKYPVKEKDAILKKLEEILCE